MLGLRKLCDKLPKSLEGIKPVLIYPLAGLGMIAVVMCTVNPFMGMIDTGLTNLLQSMGDVNEVLLGIVLGAMMSIDMGGPFNKAAYVFGTAAITSGNYDIMAAVMVGGMVPPIAIALATIFFKNRFTNDERKSGPVNFIMGAGFITEGAIPYAASDPLRVIPACMIGSGIAGGLSMLFRCTLMAPHGGIFGLAVLRKLADVSGISCRRLCCQYASAWSLQEKNQRIKGILKWYLKKLPSPTHKAFICALQ